MLDTTKDLISGALSSPHAGKGGLANGEALDQQADDEFSSEVSAAIVDWIAKRMSDYHKNFHDTQLMQVRLVSLAWCRVPAEAGTKLLAADAAAAAAAAASI